MDGREYGGRDRSEVSRRFLAAAVADLLCALVLLAWTWGLIPVAALALPDSRSLSAIGFAAVFYSVTLVYWAAELYQQCSDPERWRQTARKVVAYYGWKGLPALPAGMLALLMAEWALYGTAYFLLLLPVLLLWTAAVGPSLWQMHKM